MVNMTFCKVRFTYWPFERLGVAWTALPLLLFAACGPAPHDVVILHGRVMDPETGLDAPRHVGITGGTIAEIGEEPLRGRDTLDATGMVVAPGFIDLRARGQDSVSAALQALDGVTTALEMEVGVYPVAPWYASRQGRAPIHFGATVSHPGARARLLAGIDIGHQPTPPPGRSESMESEIIYEALDDGQVAELAALMEAGLAEGGLGYGLGIAYTPGATRGEIFELFRSAAAQDVPAYVHVREAGPGGVLGPFQEVIANAAAAGTSLHIVHLNSSAGEMAESALGMIRGARGRGVDVTTEAYPYTDSRDRGVAGLMDALARMTIMPARRVTGAAPAMARKGRVQVGADADIAVFDPETVLDMADYDAPATPSRGFAFVIVGGTPVVRDGALVEGVFPGQAIKSSHDGQSAPER